MTAPVRVVRHPSAPAFLSAAEPWLLESEAEHNLLLGLARSLVHSAEGYEGDIYLATVEVDGRVVGCAFRTPPFKLGITRMPWDALTPLVDDLSRVYAAIPAVLGPNDLALAFGETWAARHGLMARVGMRQRIYALDEVTLPAALPPGFMRPAASRDLPQVTAWLSSFDRETGIAGSPPEDRARQFVERSSLALWDAGQPVAMAGYTGATPGTVRVSYVYTPEAHRGNGYATALVGLLSRQLLEAGYGRCVLYTDLSNPTSNAIYQRLGYRPVCDVVDVELVSTR